MHVCGHVCINTFPTFLAALWTVGIWRWNFLLFFGWKYVDLHLFFLPVLFRWPPLHSWGEKTISNHRKKCSKTHVKLKHDTGMGRILEQRKRISSAGAGEISLLAPWLLPGGQQHVGAAQEELEDLLCTLLSSFGTLKRSVCVCVCVCGAFDVATPPKGQTIKTQKLCGCM